VRAPPVEPRGARAGQDGDVVGDGVAHALEEQQPLLGREGRRLAGGAADHHRLDAVLDEEGGVGGGGADVDFSPSSSKRVTRATPTPMKTGSMPRRYRDGVDVTPLDRRLVR